MMRHQCVQFSRAFLTCTCRALARCCCCRRNAAVAMFVASVSNLQLWVVVIVGIFFHVYVTSVRGDAASSMRLLLRQLADCCSCGGLSHFFHFTFLSLPVSFVSSACNVATTLTVETTCCEPRMDCYALSDRSEIIRITAVEGPDTTRKPAQPSCAPPPVSLPGASTVCSSIVSTYFCPFCISIAIALYTFPLSSNPIAQQAWRCTRESVT